jgi:hypothetical protein
MRKRVVFAEQGITWLWERVMNQIFSDKVWAMGGAHTEQYMSVKSDGSQDYLTDTVTHKYSKKHA